MKRIIIAFILSLLAFNYARTQGIDPKFLKQTTVFLGTIENNQVSFQATGFIVEISNILHLITSKHVIMENVNNKFTGKLLDSNMVIFYNLKTNKKYFKSIKEIKEKYKCNWIFHENENVDIAIIPIELNQLTDDVVIIPSDMFLSPSEILETYDVFFVSYQDGISIQNRFHPIIRSGMISLINDDSTFFMDAFAFPGNSGSPVFLKPSIRAYKGAIHLGGDPLAGKFIGLVGEYVPYRDIAISAQTKQPRVIFEENAGLAKVWSVKYIYEIINSSAFKKQIYNLRK